MDVLGTVESGVNGNTVLDVFEVLENGLDYVLFGVDTSNDESQIAVCDVADGSVVGSYDYGHKILDYAKIDGESSFVMLFGGPQAVALVTVSGGVEKLTVEFGDYGSIYESFIHQPSVFFSKLFYEESSSLDPPKMTMGLVVQNSADFVADVFELEMSTFFTISSEPAQDIQGIWQPPYEYIKNFGVPVEDDDSNDDNDNDEPEEKARAITAIISTLFFIICLCCCICMIFYVIKLMTSRAKKRSPSQIAAAPGTFAPSSNFPNTAVNPRFDNGYPPMNNPQSRFSTPFNNPASMNSGQGFQPFAKPNLNPSPYGMTNFAPFQPKPARF
jgi:hypothetical protein